MLTDLSHVRALQRRHHAATLAIMTLQDISPTTTRQAIEAKGRSAPRKCTGKVQNALNVMVWEGLSRKDAAIKAGMTDHGLREALRRPHVKAYYLAELEVLRNSERARNIHRLCEIRDHAPNMPAVNAIKVLEQISDAPQSANSHASSPGLVVIIEAPGVRDNVRVVENASVINANPLIMKEEGG